MNKFNSLGKCPKCHFEMISDKYQKGSHLHCTVSDAPDKYSSMMETVKFLGRYVSQQNWDSIDEMYKEMQAIPEHIERTCLRCGYNWPEATL